MSKVKPDLNQLSVRIVNENRDFVLSRVFGSGGELSLGFALWFQESEVRLDQLAAIEDEQRQLDYLQPKFEEWFNREAKWNKSDA